MTRRTGLYILVGLSVAAIAAVFVIPPIPQSQEYHNFADQRRMFGMPSCLNVISNLPFLLVGTLGLSFLLRPHAPDARGQLIEPRERWPYVVFFAGVALTGIGSAYYHLAPGNDRLVWDRLPMTLAFMSFLAATIAERISVPGGLRMLWPLLAIGAGSVFYWQFTELRGAGDLRPYLVVQFYPMLAIPLMVALCPARYTRGADVFAILGFYFVAKVFELLDAAMFNLARVVSGHTLKHLAASASTYWLLRMLKLRLSATRTP